MLCCNLLTFIFHFVVFNPCSVSIYRVSCFCSPCESIQSYLLFFVSFSSKFFIRNCKYNRHQRSLFVLLSLLCSFIFLSLSYQYLPLFTGSWSIQKIENCLRLLNDFNRAPEFFCHANWFPFFFHLFFFLIFHFFLLSYVYVLCVCVCVLYALIKYLLSSLHT